MFAILLKEGLVVHEDREFSFRDYQSAATETAVYPGQRKGGEQKLLGISYTVHGLTGEAGEVANALKKFMRKNLLVDEDVLADELGDVLWYAAALANELNMSLEQIAKQNIAKLARRRQEGTVAALGKREPVSVEYHVNSLPATLPLHSGSVLRVVPEPIDG